MLWLNENTFFTLTLHIKLITELIIKTLNNFWRKHMQKKYTFLISSFNFENLVARASEIYYFDDSLEWLIRINL